MNEMEFGTKTGLNLNPASLSRFSGSLDDYRKNQHPENTTPAGVAQPMVVWHFYKHSMPPASDFARAFPTFRRGNALGMECPPISIAPRFAADKSEAVTWGKTGAVPLKHEISCSGKSPLSKGVAKPGDLSLTNCEIKIPILSDGATTNRKSPFNSPFAKGDEDTATIKLWNKYFESDKYSILIT